MNKYHDLLYLGLTIQKIHSEQHTHHEYHFQQDSEYDQLPNRNYSSGFFPKFP